MKTKLIEQYIQFAIDNGYKFNIGFDVFEINTSDGILYFIGKTKYSKRGRELNNRDIRSLNIYQSITSKEFIEAIVKGLNNINGAPTHINEITIKQSLAIRDGELDLFIKEILGKQNTKN